MTARVLAAILLIAVGAAGALVYQRVVPAGETGRAGPGGGPGGFRPGGPGGFGAQPMRVNSAGVTRADIAEQLQIVGNLIGAASVEVAPKINGRLREIGVRLGDPVARGQEVARVEDDELRQQVNQAEASYEVARATVRQREADLVLAETTRDRSQSLFSDALVSRQELDDAEARFQAANAQLDLARAQFAEAGARLEELRINLENTVMVSPVDGFIGRRYLDPGAYVTSSTAVASVVDISLVRLVANLVERDLRLVQEGVRARIEVDAFPTESFEGRIARIAPVLDPATRTAEIEIEVPNPDFRLKPGMYARVSLVVGNKSQALVVPREAVVIRTSARGVFRVDSSGGSPTAQFVSLVTGLEDELHVEVIDGVSEGDRVVTTGAAGLQHGDPILLADAVRPGGRGGPADRAGAVAGRGAEPDGVAGRGAEPAAAGRAGPSPGVPGRGELPTGGPAAVGAMPAAAGAGEPGPAQVPAAAATSDFAPDRGPGPRNTVLEALGITPPPADEAEPRDGRGEPVPPSAAGADPEPPPGAGPRPAAAGRARPVPAR